MFKFMTTVKIVKLNQLTPKIRLAVASTARSQRLTRRDGGAPWRIGELRDYPHLNRELSLGWATVGVWAIMGG